MVSEICIACLCLLFVGLCLTPSLRFTLGIPAVVDARVVCVSLEVEANEIHVVNGWGHGVDGRTDDFG